jgi:ABC-type dipeptide/oligopeptide/nickel transport system permease subunit
MPIWRNFTDLVRRFLASDVYYSFKRSPTVVVAFVLTVLFMVAAAFAPWIVPHNTYEVATLNLMDAFLPPAWVQGANSATSSVPTIRAATCSRPSFSAPACRCWSDSPPSLSR